MSAESSQELRRIFVAKATDAALILDDDDLVVLDQACAVADILTQLDADISANGVTTTNSAGTVKVNAAVVESRQQRIALTRLMAVMDQRINAARAGVPSTGQGGVRGVHVGDGSQNQARDSERANRRGETRQNRTAARRA
ncbi:MAG: hypothetical protein WBB62_08210 [Rhodococcus sp. (in: high G+C Gram-positive bacteria)]